MSGVVTYGRFASPVPAVALGQTIISYDNSVPYAGWEGAIEAAIAPLVDGDAVRAAYPALAAVEQLYQLPTAELSYLLGLPDTVYTTMPAGAITYKVPGGWSIRVPALGYTVFIDDALNPASITAGAIPAGGDPTPYTPSGVSVYVPPFWTDFVKSAEDYSGWSGEAGSWGGDWVPEEPEVYGPYGPYEVVMVAGAKDSWTAGFGSGFGSLEPSTISTPVGGFPLREISTSTMGYLRLHAGRSYLIEKVLVTGAPGGAVEVAPYNEVPVSAPFVDGETYNLQLTFYVKQEAWPPEDKTGTYLLNFVAQAPYGEPTADVTVDGVTFSLYWSASESLLYLGATYGEDGLPLEFNSIVMTGDLGPVTFVPNDPGELNHAWAELPGGQQLVDNEEYSITLVVS